MPLIRVKDIRRFESQPRDEFPEGHIARLAESLKNGVEIPIIVRELDVGEDPNHRYELIDGECRWRAAKEAGLETIDAVIRKVTDAGDQHLRSLKSNFIRQDHTPIEIARALKFQRDRGLPVEALASALGKSDSWVYQHLSLLRLAPYLQEKMKHSTPLDERLSFFVGVTLAGIPNEEEQIKKYKEMLLLPTHSQRQAFATTAARVYAKEAGLKRRGRPPHKDSLIFQRFVRSLDKDVERIMQMDQRAFKSLLSTKSPEEVREIARTLKRCSKHMMELEDVLSRHLPPSLKVIK